MTFVEIAQLELAGLSEENVDRSMEISLHLGSVLKVINETLVDVRQWKEEMVRAPSVLSRGRWLLDAAVGGSLSHSGPSDAVS